MLTGGALTRANVAWARALGAPAVFALGGDTSALAADAGVRLDAPGTGGERHHARQRLLHDLPDRALAALDAFDPHRRALVLGDNFFDGASLAGRRYVGRRLNAWAAWEDKCVVDQLFARAALDRSPVAVVPARGEPLLAAHAQLDAGAGTVWSGDSRDWPNGSGEHVRWVRSTTDTEDATRFFAGHADRVRVMPYVTGQACSIHGLVTADGVAVLRSVEQIVVLTTAHRFRWAGASTHWRPPAKLEEGMRSAARRLGDALDASCGYRGFFSLDGIAHNDTFIPTEVNPRWGAALMTITRAVARTLPLRFLHSFIANGTALGCPPVAFGDAVAAASTAHPHAAAWLSTDVPIDGERSATFADLVVHVSPRGQRSEVWLEFGTTTTDSVTTTATAAFRWADATYHLGLSLATEDGQP